MRLAIVAIVVACACSAPATPPPARPSLEAGSDSLAQPSGLTYDQYYERIKSAVYAEWNPSPVWRRLASVDRPSVSMLTTWLAVVLQPDGHVTDVTVKRPCGVPAIDDEGVRAMRAAAPFLNPPKELLKDGTFTFMFELNFEIGSPAK